MITRRIHDTACRHGRCRRYAQITVESNRYVQNCLVCKRRAELTL